MKEQKRVNLTHGTARVDKDISQGTIDALNKLSEAAYDMKEPEKEARQMIANFLTINVSHDRKSISAFSMPLEAAKQCAIIAIDMKIMTYADMFSYTLATHKVLRSYLNKRLDHCKQVLEAINKIQ